MKNQDAKFEEMRPYKDKEITEAIDRVLKNKLFYTILGYLFSEEEMAELVENFKQSKTQDDIAYNFSNAAFSKAVSKSTSSFTFSGLDQLDKHTAYLFISNHRDIVLDSAITQLALGNNGYKLSQITFGSNLMANQLLVDIGKLNNMFTFYRGGSRIQVYRNALLHSAYMSHVITDLNESLWIAQRDGRTKDGKDATQLSLLKMLMVTDPHNIASIRKFNIVPLSISYEYEPCALQKAIELYKREQGPYEKSENEDISSVISGITEPKGNVHLHFGQPLNERMDAKKEEKELSVEDVCALMDEEIHQSYTLWPNNYIAHDALQAQPCYVNKEYTLVDEAKFYSYLEEKLALCPEPLRPTIKQRILAMYAAPVDAKLAL